MSLTIAFIMLIRIIALLLSRMPLVLLHGLGFCLGWAVWFMSSSYRALFRDMLGQAIPSSDPRHHAVLRRAIGETGKGLLELPYVWFRMDDDSAAHKVVCDDWDVVESVRASGRSLLFLTPHMGCFEVAAQALALRAPITVLYRPNRNAVLQSMIESRRQRHNLALAPTDLSGVRRLFKALKRGEAIGILPDQVPSNGEGIWVPAWGKPAYTMNLPAKLRSQTGAVVVLAAAVRLPWGRGWRMTFENIDALIPNDPVEGTAAINKVIEDMVLRYPDQYYWAYNRYKVPEGVAAIGSGAPDRPGDTP